jgi:hypothetical protein
VAQGFQASAEETFLQGPKEQTDRPLQLLLCSGEFPFGVVILWRSYQICEEVVESQEPKEKLQLGKIQASA